MKNSLFQYIKEFLVDRFSLDEEKASEDFIIQSIRKGVEFRGINIWALIFAIMVASVGLNVNSTAVIIGAMLISPLMGPIMGIGLGVGIYDFELIWKAFRNLIIAVAISVITSALYFALTPLDEAQSELLARTTPTIWDVLIAFFGGLAGIVAGSVKDKGNVIPGVAIATALMPPLCTAGYGLGTGNFYYFLGAFYLFSINAVMISLSTFLIVKFLKFKTVTFVDEATEKRIKRYVYIVTVITVLPSLYLGYKIVQQTFYERNARQFVKNEIHFPESQILQREIDYNKKNITLTLFGKTVEQEDINKVIPLLPKYNLASSKLIVRQGSDGRQNLDVNSLKTGLLEDIFKEKEALLQQKQAEIDTLRQDLNNIRHIKDISGEVAKELKALYPTTQSVALSRTEVLNTEGVAQDTLCLAVIKMNSRPPSSTQKQIENWLIARTLCKKAKVLFEK